MRSEPSKPSSEAGSGPAARVMAQRAAMPMQRRRTDAACAAHGHLNPAFSDQQAAYAPPWPPLTGRHKAPTGAPTSTNVRVGGEGTPSARAVDRPSARAWPAVVTLPNGARKRFPHLPCFDAYVSVWRAEGFLLTWDDPWNVVITPNGPDATTPKFPELPVHQGNPHAPLEASHGQA
jgi:hypothetical protein